MRALSGGMKRRVLVAQALVHKPPVIVLDEPTAGVDVELRQGLWAFIRKLNRDGHTIVLTTHYLEEAEALCSRIAMLKAGRVVALDTTQNLLSSFAGLTVRLTVDALPEAWPTACSGTKRGRICSRWATMPNSNACSPSLRERGIAIDELSLQEADLEEVFLRIMKRARMSTSHGSCTGLRLAHAVLQGGAALLEGELPDGPRAGADVAALSADLLARARVARVGVRRRVPYTAFLVPGLVMMSVLQNAFANSSSSLIQSKITGNLIFVLLPPLSPLDIFGAYVLGAMVRGLVVGAGVFLVTLWFVPLSVRAPALGARLRAAGQRDPRHPRARRGHRGGQIRSGRGIPEFPDHAAHVPVGRVLFDPLAAAVLAGAVALQSVLLYDRRFRYGFFGLSDIAPWQSFAVVATCCAALAVDDARNAQARLQAAALRTLRRCRMVTPEYIKQAIEAGLACEQVEVDGDGQHFQALIVSRRVRGHEPGEAPPARIRRARRSHARGDPRAVDADPHPAELDKA